jgi:hypothetical protein
MFKWESKKQSEKRMISVPTKVDSSTFGVVSLLLLRLALKKKSPKKKKTPYKTPKPIVKIPFAIKKTKTVMYLKPELAEDKTKTLADLKRGFAEKKMEQAM